MIGTTADLVIGVEFRVGADEQNVLRWTEFLADTIDYFGRADRQFHLQSFSARVVVPGFRGDAQIRLHSDIAPLGREFRWRGVTLEVVRQDDGRVALDVLVAGVARSDSTICWRIRSEKCNYSRKRHKPGTSDYWEPHECVCAAKSAP